jgi:tight adherence protein C
MIAAYLLVSIGFQLVGLPVALSSALVAVVIGLLGYYLPDLWLWQMTRARRVAIRRQLPEVCDLLSVCADAGASFDVALLRVVESPYLNGPLIDELQDAVRNFQFAESRYDALNGLAQRLQVEELTSFVSALGQYFNHGAKVAEVLRIQAEDIRRRARERAEEQANAASVQMLFPLVFLIFPTLFLVIMTPALITTINSINGGR